MGVDAPRRPLAGRHRAHRDRTASPASRRVIAILFILVVALAGLGIAVVNALAESAWGTFTIGMTIPLALFMGLYMFRWRKGHIKEATILGVTLMFLGGGLRQERRRVVDAAHFFLLTPHQITLAMAIYAFAASMLPVWMLLTPRALPQHLHEDRHDRCFSRSA